MTRYAQKPVLLEANTNFLPMSSSYTSQHSTNELLEQAIKEFKEAEKVLKAFTQKPYMEEVVSAARLMAQTLGRGQKILCCGNGGSACDAMHFAEELSGRFRADRPPLAAISLHDPAHMSCVANDYDFKYVFSRYLEALGQKGDLLLALSTSGRSPNIIEALRVAKQKKITTVVLSGGSGGELEKLPDIKILVPHTGFSDRIQEIHIKIIHVMIFLIEKELFL